MAEQPTTEQAASTSPAMARRGRTVRMAERAARLRADLMFGIVDSVLVAAAYLGVLAVRFDGATPGHFWEGFGWFLPLAVAVHVAANAGFHLYGQLWQHASVEEARRVLLAGLSSTGTLLAADVLIRPRPVPVSVVLVGGALATMLVGASRFQSRLFAVNRSTATSSAVRVVVVGAGEAAAMIVRDMLRDREAGLVPVAVLDDDPAKRGRALVGVPVVGSLDDVAAVAQAVDAHRVLLCVSAAPGDLVRRVAAQAESVGLPLKVLPSVAELVGGRVSIRDVRDVRIEDLLGRQQVHTDLEAVAALVAGRRVLITGAGGSIGSEIARQVQRLDPHTLVLLDHDETHLHDVAADLGPGPVQVLADVRDATRVLDVFDAHRPEVVFHAAAHKHVPVLESHPCEAVLTNVGGTRNVVAAARAVGAAHLVFISTDKAVRPSSVMGASKSLGERIVLAAAPPGAKWCAVRFGNVLGSRGSVVPTFMRQIESGGPVTVTDARMTRYFMSISEAVQLVLQAAAQSQRPEIFMLDMGEPVNIRELAERMIRLAGRQVGTDVEIRITGARPGEKLAEELTADHEQVLPTEHPSIRRVLPAADDPGRLGAWVGELERLARQRDDDGAAEFLMSLPAADSVADQVIDLRDPAVAEAPSAAPTVSSSAYATTSTKQSASWNPSTT